MWKFHAPPPSKPIGINILHRFFSLDCRLVHRFQLPTVVEEGAVPSQLTRIGVPSGSVLGLIV